MAYWFRMSSTCSSCSVIGTRECILSIHRADNYDHNSMETSLINATKVLSCAFPEREPESCYLALDGLSPCVLCGTDPRARHLGRVAIIGDEALVDALPPESPPCPHS